MPGVFNTNEKVLTVKDEYVLVQVSLFLFAFSGVRNYLNKLNLSTSIDKINENI